LPMCSARELLDKNFPDMKIISLSSKGWKGALTMQVQSGRNLIL
jgi:hypothetical protein